MKAILFILVALLGFLVKPILWIIAFFKKKNEIDYYHTIRKFVQPNACCEKFYYEKFDTFRDFDMLDSALIKNFKYIGHTQSYSTQPDVSFIFYSLGSMDSGGFRIYQCVKCGTIWELLTPENADRGYFKPINLNLDSIKEYFDNPQ